MLCYFMPLKRITISVSNDIAKAIKRAAGSTPVSSWVANVIVDHLNDAELERQWEQFYRDVNPSRAAQRKADAVFRRLTKRPNCRGTA
jgi:hypothetical protein